MRPVELPDYRRRVLASMDKPGFWPIIVGKIQSGKISSSAGFPESMDEYDLADRYVAALKVVISRSELFFATDDMCELANVASSSLPPTRLSAQTFPSSNGLMYFSSLNACIIWNLEPAHNDAVWLVYISLTDDNNIRLLPTGTIDLNEDFVSEPREISSVLISSLILMAQPLVSVAKPTLTKRQSKRAGRRAELDPRQVSIITLRRTSTRSKGANSVEREHRWAVRGHWRNQWHPRDECHVPTWISPYVKGPEGKPLIVRERVNLWSH